MYYGHPAHPASCLMLETVAVKNCGSLAIIRVGVVFLFQLNWQNDIPNFSFVPESMFTISNGK